MSIDVHVLSIDIHVLITDLNMRTIDFTFKMKISTCKTFDWFLHVNDWLISATMSEWIAVCGEEGDNPIEVETEDGKSIPPPSVVY